MHKIISLPPNILIVHTIQYKELSASENLFFRFIIHYKKARVNTSYIVYYYKQYINYRNQKESIRKYNKKRIVGNVVVATGTPSILRALMKAGANEALSIISSSHNSTFTQVYYYLCHPTACIQISSSPYIAQIPASCL